MVKKTDGTYTGNPRFQVRLDNEVYQALSNAAKKDELTTNEKAKLLLITALKDLGLLRKDY